MRRILLTLGVLLISMTMSAQLVFVDADGRELADGSTITMNNAVKNDWGEIQVDLKGISIKNTSAIAQDFTMDVEVKELPAGGFACCYGTTCKNTKKPSTMNLKNLSIDANATEMISNTEWVMEEDGNYGTCAVTFKLSTGNTLNVNFVYAESTDISHVSEKAEITAIYDITGKSIKTMQKGMNIVHYSDGTVKKIIIK